MTDPGTDKAATEAAPDSAPADAPETEASDTSAADSPSANAPAVTPAAGSSELSASPDTASENNAYDFRQPARLAADVAVRVAEWQQRVASLLPEKLCAHVPALACDALPPEVGAPNKVAPPHPLIAFRLQVAGTHETILGINRPLAVTLVTAMLGETPESILEDRELTLVEQSLFELLVRDLVELLDESGQPLGISVAMIGGERRTQFIRLFPPGKSIALLNFRVEGVFGAANLCWTWPQDILEATMETDEEQEPSPHLRELAQRIPFDVVVRLGRAHLSVQELTQLKPGDVVVLDQPVAEPLIGEIGGCEKLRVWPGREGSRQAVRIAAMIEEP